MSLENLIAPGINSSHKHVSGLNETFAHFQSVHFPYDKEENATASLIDIRIQFPGMLSERWKHSALPDEDIYCHFISALFILLHKYTGVTEMVIDAQYGIAIHASVKPDHSCNDLLSSVKDHIHEMPGKSMERSADVLISKERALMNEMPEDILKNYKTVFFLEITKGACALHIMYNSLYYEQQSIIQIGEQFFEALLHLLDDPGQTIKDLNVMSAGETDKVVRQFNDRKQIVPDLHFLELFNGQVVQNADNTAVVFENTGISFKELDYRSSLLAQQLKNKIAGPGQVIALFFNRSVEMMISIMGIMKAGCAYLPIDPKYPSQRVAYILEDSKVEYVLTCSDLIEKMPAGKPLQIFDYFELRSEPVSLTENSFIIKAGQLAYVIYTSASTGNPKGVMITHSNLANFIYAMQDIIPLSAKEKLLMLAPISFDLSISETLLPLASGTTVFIASEKEQEDPVYFNDCICRNNITMVHCTPSRLSTFLSDVRSLSWLNEIKFMMVGGEAFSVNLFRKLKGYYKGEVYNLYGPTEATVWSTFKKLSNSGKVNIGRPLVNNTIYILDENNRLSPIGVAGELCIGGNNVSLGYLNNKELTESKFIPDPFKKEGFIYKTGDLARWNAQGEIEYVGRIDHQVKIRGYRVELKEIEYTLLKYPGITSAIAAVKEAANRERYICAYVISEEKIGFPELKSFLTGFLPDYMVPAFYFQLPEFPVTFNGKIDYKALPFVNKNGNEENLHESSPVHSGMEAIWREVLGVEIQSADDNFFEIGGHSLNGIILINKIWEVCKVKITLTDLFQYSTINLLAEYISTRQVTDYNKIPATSIKDHYVLSPAQKRMYILQFIDPQSTGYNISQFYLVTGELNINKINSIFQELVNRHESLRTSFKFVDDEVVQQVQENVKFSIATAEIGNESGIEGSIRAFVRPFDLGSACLLKVKLVKIAASNRHLLMLDMHHIIADGVSLNILINEFITLYQGGQLETLTIQYKDYSEWLFKNANDVYGKQEQYWINQFAQGVPLLNLSDHERPAGLSNEGSIVKFIVEPARVLELKSLCDEYSVTLNMLLTSVYAYVLNRLSNQNEFVIGTIISGRNHPGMEKVIGMFANFLPLKIVIKKNDNFMQFLKRTKDTMIRSYENQDYPFDMLVDKLKIKRQYARNPVFDTMLVFHSEADLEETIGLPGATLTKYKIKSETSLLDFKIDIFKRQDGRLDCNLFYKKSLFTEDDMTDLSADILATIDKCIEDPEFDF